MHTYLGHHAILLAYILFPLLRTMDSRCFCTYNWTLSLYLGDQLLDFDLVANFLFLSAKWGPMRLTSTNGLNIPPAVVGHRRSLAATTVRKREAVSTSCFILATQLHGKVCQTYRDHFISGNPSLCQQVFHFPWKYFFNSKWQQKMVTWNGNWWYFTSKFCVIKK